MSYLDEPSPYRVGGALVVGAYVVARILGFPLWLPVILSLAAFAALGKVRPQAGIAIRYALGIVSGQALWILAGVVVNPSMLVAASPDIVLSAALIAWLLLSLSKAPAYALIAYEVVLIGLNGAALVEATAFDPFAMAVIVHLTMRVLVIGLVVHALRNGMFSVEAEAEEIDEVFS